MNVRKYSKRYKKDLSELCVIIICEERRSGGFRKCRRVFWLVNDSHWSIILTNYRFLLIWKYQIETPSKPISAIKIKLFEQHKKHSTLKLTWRKSVFPISENSPLLKITGKFLNFQLEKSRSPEYSGNFEIFYLNEFYPNFKSFLRWVLKIIQYHTDIAYELLNFFDRNPTF